MSNEREKIYAKSDPLSRTDVAYVALWAVIGVLFAVAIAGLLTLIVAWLVPDPVPDWTGPPQSVKMQSNTGRTRH